MTVRSAYEPPVAPGAAPPVIPFFAFRDSTRRFTPEHLPLDSLDRRYWLLTVALRPDGRVISRVGLYGGYTTSTCGEFRFREIVAGDAPTAAFAGGGVFDLAGRLAGVVVLCGDRVAVAAVADVERALLVANAFDARLRRRYGFRVGGLDSLAQAYFRADSGVMVAEVWNGRGADAAGLRPGDVITAVDDAPVRGSTDLMPLTRTGNSSHRLTLLRAGRPVTLSLNGAAPPDTGTGAGPPAGSGIAIASQIGATIEQVAPGSAAARAGVAPGDRVLRLGAIQDPTPAQLRLRLSRPLTAPIFLVVERDGRRRGVFLQP